MLQPAKKKPRGRPWTPGQSGNPSGRTPIPAEIVNAAREMTMDALNTLRDVMLNAPESGARIRAAEAILDRGWGRAMQAIDLAVVNQRQLDRSPRDIPLHELESILSGKSDQS